MTSSDWPTCQADPGCRGIQTQSDVLCLAHLDPLSQRRVLADLHPGDDVDVRGVRFTDDLLAALTAPGSDHPRLGHARFVKAEFPEGANFAGASWCSQLSTIWISAAHG